MLIFLESILYLFIFIFGTCIFSFLNVVIYRVPKKINFINGRSRCPNCDNVLRPIDMIPVFSFLFLKGKCHFCKSKISPRYAIVESIGGITAVICVLYYGFDIRAVIAYSFIAMLTAVAFVDMDTLEIPNGFVIVLILIGIISYPFFQEINIISRLIGMVEISLPMLIVVLFIPNGFGGGDIKLMASCGIFLGWKLILLSFFIGAFVASVVYVVKIIQKKADKKTLFAFGPYLSIGMIISLFLGNYIINWYLSFAL